jgi:hypothetical protein
VRGIAGMVIFLIVLWANLLVGGLVSFWVANRRPDFKLWVEANPMGGLGRALVFELWPLVLYGYLLQRSASKGVSFPLGDKKGPKV